MRTIKNIYLIILISCFMILQASFMYAADTSKQITMNFNDVDIRVFIKFISELTGKNFIIVMGFPFDVYGKNEAKNRGFTFALTITFD